MILATIKKYAKVFIFAQNYLNFVNNKRLLAIYLQRKLLFNLFFFVFLNLLDILLYYFSMRFLHGTFGTLLQYFFHTLRVYICKKLFLFCFSFFFFLVL